MQGHTRQDWAGDGGGGRRKHGQEPLLWFLREGTGEMGYAGLGLSS